MREGTSIAVTSGNSLSACCKRLNKAAEQNFPEAQYNLANAYRDGVVVQKNEEKALELYLKSAEQNLPEAQSNAAYICKYL